MSVCGAHMQFNGPCVGAGSWATECGRKAARRRRSLHCRGVAAPVRWRVLWAVRRGRAARAPRGQRLHMHPLHGWTAELAQGRPGLRGWGVLWAVRRRRAVRTPAGQLPGTDKHRMRKRWLDGGLGEADQGRPALGGRRVLLWGRVGRRRPGQHSSARLMSPSAAGAACACNGQCTPVLLHPSRPQDIMHAQTRTSARCCSPTGHAGQRSPLRGSCSLPAAGGLEAGCLTRRLGTCQPLAGWHMPVHRAVDRDARALRGRRGLAGGRRRTAAQPSSVTVTTCTALERAQWQAALSDVAGSLSCCWHAQQPASS